ncbi:MAG: restriction endonuclease subunit S [Nitrospirae bacterium]|nr:restriction endonuclease subunit S [Nitrospirota bacterium]
MEKFELPDSWILENLSKYVNKLESGSRPRGGVSQYLNGVPSISAQQIKEDGSFYWDSIKYVPEDYYLSTTRGKIKPNDILIVKDGATTGKCAYVNRDFPFQKAMVNEHTFILRTKSTLLAKYCYYYLASSYCIDFFRHSRKRGMIGGLTSSFPSEINVPVPPLAEQNRIVSHIENQTSRITQISRALFEHTKDFHETLYGVYADCIKNVEYLPMSEAAPLVRRPIKVDLSAQYPELGIRSFGKGTFHKPALTGKELGSKRIFTIEEGDLLFNIVFAWEGAVAIAKREDHGRVGSHRFLTCVPQKGIATSAFLCFHFLTEKGLHDLGDASPGGAGRNRTLGLKSLDKIKVPVPPYEKQVWFSRLWEKVNTARQLQIEISSHLAAFTPALLAKAFRGDL